MNLPIQVPLCILSWVFTLLKLRTFRWRDFRKDNGVALYVWFTTVFFSIGFTFLIKDFGDFFDVHTFNNFSKLITYSSFLTTTFLGTVAFIKAAGKPFHTQMIRWLWLAFLLVAITLVAIYAIFISKIPEIDYYVAQSLPEAIFKFVMFSFSLLLCVVLSRVYLVYLPSEESPLMRARMIVLIMTALSSGAYFFVMTVLDVGGYFSPLMASQWLVDLSTLFFILSALLIFASLISNKIYVQIIVVLRSIHSWNAFQDLRYLMEGVLVLCPAVALPPNNPSFWRFLLNPEYYLYRAIVIVLDGKTMLADFLSSSLTSSELPSWDDDMLREAVRFNQALQATNPTGEFPDIVDAYRRVSQDLFKNQTNVLADAYQ